MAVVKKGLISLVALISFIGAFFTGSPSIHAAAAQSEEQTIITEWQMLWEQPGQSLTIEEVSSLSDNDGWFTVHSDGEYPSVPEGIDSAWIKFRLPELTQMRPAMYLDKLFSRDVKIFINDRIVFELIKDYPFNRNKIVVPITQSESYNNVFLKLESTGSQLGLKQKILLDEFNKLSSLNVKSDLIDIVLGASLVFISVLSLFIIFFNNRFVLREWYSLCMVMLCIGIMILSYPPFFHSTYNGYGELFYYCFDLSSNLFLPALFYFFEKVFGNGPYNLIKRFRIMHFYLAVFYLMLKVGSLVSQVIEVVYYKILPPLFGLSIVISIIALIVVLIQLCKKKNEEAIIITFGFGSFSLIGISEIILYFAFTKMYQFSLWKIGVFLFLASLMIVLVRRAIFNYMQVIAYSKQLELFNNQLQRSEKMETISQLAASVAHEVRNPLQVTRGFLQLLRERTLSDKDKTYMLLAIDELDRASEIITDFLTFAKPGTEMNTVINIREELQQIEAVLIPLATMQGVTIKVVSSFDAFVKGNSSKFKQALLNIIKNSIEATEENGVIQISLNENVEDKEVHICIEDDGIGMEKEVIMQLGEPFYSQKSKGTGLGLMVTFRIIEAMNGRINYESEKGKGTRVSMYFPLT
ncbi:hypothetical protein B1748_33265 [Paenibacillus sp. MY03]|uniref:ATP-binding protein n=1 Tax=Paenibacillus sp. MY03 TaxID=302980 RepID=UPI000B3CCD85|nr:ATP-binding protein [Paenibacillus sp. MY03]OUS68610.1 hypothetical protein B1748_33265 [Paenibacillus sp. MY03]